ncbi:MAG: DUF2892 domain-containing protein [Firmicutes bacterium HGW-Firmicutes-21]|nr:MAG: DUF2892 domain-containing protein [Firmicutes bacterium HGW-Firmicutes-21]
MFKKILPPTTKRVQNNTSPNVNNEIRNQTISNLNTYKSADVNILNDRIDRLNNECDIERVMQTNTASMILLSSIIGLKKSKWFILTGIIGFFMLQHSIKGNCPLLPIARKMGVRTATEINNEITVLKMARGDFANIPDNAEDMLNIAEK